jgi:beta-glucosidase
MTYFALGSSPTARSTHWDLPQTIQDRGGWQNRDTAHAFAHYAGYIAGKIADRVKHFMTINEFSGFVPGESRWTGMHQA